MRTAAVKRVIVLATILALAIGAGSSGAETTQRVPEKYSFVTIDYPGSVWTTLSAINNNGQVVGDYSLTHGIDAGKNVRSFVRSLKQGRASPSRCRRVGQTRRLLVSTTLGRS